MLIRAQPRRARGDRYAINRPLGPQFWREIGCEEARCPHYLSCQHSREGWKTLVDENTSLGREQASYIRKRSMRRFTERSHGPGLTVFIFAPGQRCFHPHEKHWRPVERSPQFVQERQSAGGVLLPFPEWADRFNDHMAAMAAQGRRG